MFRARLKFAFRALLKNKTYSLLNIVGLALGLSVSLIIFLYLNSEFGFDKHVPNHETIYRVEGEFKINNEIEQFAGSSRALAPLLAKEYDYIDDYTRLYHIDVNVRFKSKNKSHYEEDIAIADNNFFEVFEIPMLKGDRKTCLKEPQSLVVTQHFAQRYFGETNPVGKQVSTSNHTYTVTGLIANWPSNSHHKFDAVLSAFNDTLDLQEQLNSLWQVNVFTFLKLPSSDQADRLVADFPGFYDKYMRPMGESFGGHFQIQLSELSEIHFGRSLQYDRKGGDKSYLYAFAAISLIVLILAGINFVNMATARGMKRVKEAGLRKVLGANKAEIRWLVFLESFLLSFASLFMAFVLVELVLELTPFNEVLQKDLSLSHINTGLLAGVALLLTSSVSVLSAWYPAFSLSKVPGLSAIRGGYQLGKRSVRMRRILVGFQFCISVAVVITALGMYRQMNYVSNKDLGFNKEDILLVSVEDSVTASRIPKIQEQLANSPYVMASSTSFSVPGRGLGRSVFSLESEVGGLFEQKVIDNMQVSLGYCTTMEMEVVEGRDFKRKDNLSEEKAVLVNQKMVEEQGWEQPIGKRIRWGFDESGEEMFYGTVVGVVANFNAHSLHESIKPTVLFLKDNQLGTFHIRVDSEHLKKALVSIEKVWAKHNPENSFQFSFLNKTLANLYQEEQRQSQLILYLTYMAIFISFLGLTGLASFTTGLRTREIGIRKVLGADVFQMVNLIFKEMFTLIVLSILLALPLAYLLIKAWLSGFAFSASLNPLIFAFSALVAALLAYLIISYHSLKVARNKPVDTLKYE